VSKHKSIADWRQLTASVQITPQTIWERESTAISSSTLTVQ
jgi:hypothetical protein